MTYSKVGDSLNRECYRGINCSYLPSYDESKMCCVATEHKHADCVLGEHSKFEAERYDTMHRDCSFCGWKIECLFEHYWSGNYGENAHDFCKSKKWVNV